MQKTLTPCKKMFQFLRWMKKTSYTGISAEGYQRKHEMQVASKKINWKNNKSVPKTCDILPLKNIFFQNLTDAFFKYL